MLRQPTWMCIGKRLGIAISSVLLLLLRLAMRPISLIIHNGVRPRPASRISNFTMARRPSVLSKLFAIFYLALAAGGTSDAATAEDPGDHVRHLGVRISASCSVGVCYRKSKVKAHALVSSSSSLLKPPSYSKTHLHSNNSNIKTIHSIKKLSRAYTSLLTPAKMPTMFAVSFTAHSPTPHSY